MGSRTAANNPNRRVSLLFEWQAWPEWHHCGKDRQRNDPAGGSCSPRGHADSVTPQASPPLVSPSPTPHLLDLPDTWSQARTPDPPALGC